MNLHKCEGKIACTHMGARVHSYIKLLLQNEMSSITSKIAQHGKAGNGGLMMHLLSVCKYRQVVATSVSLSVSVDVGVTKAPKSGCTHKEIVNV